MSHFSSAVISSFNSTAVRSRASALPLWGRCSSRSVTWPLAGTVRPAWRANRQRMGHGLWGGDTRVSNWSHGNTIRPRRALSCSPRLPLDCRLCRGFHGLPSARHEDRFRTSGLHDRAVPCRGDITFNALRGLPLGYDGGHWLGARGFGQPNHLLAKAGSEGGAIIGIDRPYAVPALVAPRADIRRLPESGR